MLEELLNLIIELVCWPFRFGLAIVKLLTSPIRWILAPIANPILNTFRNRDRAFNRNRGAGKIRRAVNLALIISVAVLMVIATIKIQQLSQLSAFCAAGIAFLPSWMTHPILLKDLWPLSFLPTALLSFLKLNSISFPAIFPTEFVTRLCETANEWGIVALLGAAYAFILGISGWIGSKNFPGLIAEAIARIRFGSVSGKLGQIEKSLEELDFSELPVRDVRNLKIRLRELAADLDNY